MAHQSTVVRVGGIRVPVLTAPAVVDGDRENVVGGPVSLDIRGDIDADR